MVAFQLLGSRERDVWRRRLIVVVVGAEALAIWEEGRDVG